MENKILKAAVFAMMVGVAGSSMAAIDNDKNILNPYDIFGNTNDETSKYQTVFGSNSGTTGAHSSAYGYASKANGVDTTAIGSTASASDEKATAVGNYVTASGKYSLALGAGASVSDTTTAGAEKSVAIGYKAVVSMAATESIAFGSGTNAKAVSSVVIGKDATSEADATDGLAIGTSSSVAAANAVALGVSSYAGSSNAMVLGNGSRVATEAADAVAIGTGSYVKVANAVAIGKDAAVSAVEDNPEDRVVSFGHTTDDTYYDAENKRDVAYSSAQTSRLINVTAGYQETDAVNFSQIKTTARTDDDLKNGTYIKSSLETDQETGKTSLNTEGTVGKNIEALDKKMAVSDQTVTLATTVRDANNLYKGQNNQIVSNDGTVLATFQKGTLEEGTSLTATDFVTNGDVYAAIAARAQKISLDETERDKPITNKDGKTVKLKQNTIYSNNGDELVTFTSAEYKKDDKGFVSGGLLWSHSIAEKQTPSFATTSTGDTAAEDDTNVIRDNDGKALVRFTEGVAAVTKGETAKATIDDANFISARNAYANDVQYAQDLTLNIANSYTTDIYTNAGAKVGTIKIEGGEIATGNTGFVTGDQVWKAIAKYNQTIDFSKVDTSTNSSTATNDILSNEDEGGTEAGGTGTGEEDGTGTGGATGEEGGTTGGDSGDESGTTGEGGGSTEGGDGGTGEEGGTEGGDQGGSDSGDTSGQASNKIYTNDGRVIAEFKQAEIKKGDTGFATGGQVYGQALEEGQAVSFDSEKNVIKNNDGTTLVTFTKAEVEEDNTGFATGGQVWSNAIAEQTISFEEGKNVIKDNAGNKLVTFQSGEAKEGDTGFVSGDAAWKGDVKKATLTLESGKDAVIQNNNGDDLVTIQHGKVEEGNTGFVSGGDVYENTKNIKADISKDIDAVDKRVDQTEQQISSLGGKVSDVENRVEKVGAGAAALAALHPLDYDPNAKLSFAIGYGNYRSTSAAAIGAFIRPNNRFMWSIGATLGNGENMYNTGLSFAIGSGKGIRMSRAELDFKVGQLSDSLTQMTEEHQTFARDNAQQDAAILDLHARLKRVEEILAQLTAK